MKIEWNWLKSPELELTNNEKDLSGNFQEQEQNRNENDWLSEMNKNENDYFRTE